MKETTEYVKALRGYCESAERLALPFMPDDDIITIKIKPDKLLMYVQDVVNDVKLNP